MKTKHTSGPWTLSFVNGICIGVQTDDNPAQMIVNTILPDTDADYKNEKEEIEANAKLIAAAPELLESLKEMLRHTDGNCKEYPTTSLHQAELNARKAIKKATE